MCDENNPQHNPRSRTYPQPVPPQQIIVTETRNSCVVWLLAAILIILALPVLLVILAGLLGGLAA